MNDSATLMGSDRIGNRLLRKSSRKRMITRLTVIASSSRACFRCRFERSIRLERS
jgi:hypothetical protein